MKSPRKKSEALAVLRDYWNATLRHPLLFAGVVLGSLLIEASGVIAPLYIRDFINTISGQEPTEQVLAALFLILALYGGVVLAGWVGRRVQMLTLMFLEARVMVRLYDTAYTYLMGHAHDFFTSNFAGTLQRRVSRYAQSYESVLDTIIFNFVSTAAFAIGAIYVLGMRNMYLGLALFVWTILFIWIQIALARWRQPLRLARSAEDSKVTGVLSDSISNQSTVTLFAAQSHERSQLNGAIKKWYDATIKSWVADAWIFAIQGLFALAIELLLLGGAVLLWKQGMLTVGDFVLIQVYVIGLIERMWGIGSSMRRLYSAFADANEMIEIFDTPHAVQDMPEARSLTVSTGAIAFDDVTFSFKEAAPVLSHFALTIPAHQKLALVGPSGAGKSTVTKLLLRLYDVTGGAITIDGQDIREVTQESLRSAIAFVPQEPILFHRSLRDNIRYARPDATDEEVIAAAQKAHCHDFISALPEGYDTHVGERGVKLSGGERQRVAIARAILKNAPILILDEATSALDSESESLIQDALKTLMEGKTVIVIAHRLSTIMKMDRIVVIESGAIVADGTHDDLLKEEGGLYHKLWSIQAGSFLASTGHDWIN